MVKNYRLRINDGKTAQIENVTLIIRLLAYFLLRFSTMQIK